MGTDARGIPRCPLDDLIVIVRDAREDRKVRPIFEIEHESRVFDRLPRRLEEQSVLRINVGRLPRRDAKKLGIKLIDRIEKAAAFRDRFPDDAGFRIVKAFHIPPIRRHLGNSLAAFHEQLPK